MDEIVHSKMVIHFGKYVTKWHQWDPMVENCNSIRKISSKIIGFWKICLKSQLVLKDRIRNKSIKAFLKICSKIPVSFGR
jgi:hypothetical protein